MSLSCVIFFNGFFNTAYRAPNDLAPALVLNFLSYHFLPHSLPSCQSDFLVPQMHQLTLPSEQLQFHVSTAWNSHHSALGLVHCGLPFRYPWKQFLRDTFPDTLHTNSSEAPIRWRPLNICSLRFPLRLLSIYYVPFHLCTISLTSFLPPHYTLHEQREGPRLVFPTVPAAHI